MLCYYLLEGNHSRQRFAVDHIPIPPLHPVTSFLVEGGVGSAPSSRSISLDTSSFRHCLSSLRIAFIAQPSLRMWACSRAGSQRAETLLLNSLHVSAKIHPFFLTS